MLEAFKNIIGSPPLGFEFAEYFFSFALVLFGLFIVYRLFLAILEIFK